MSKKTLNDITGQLLDMFDEIADNDGEITDELITELDDVECDFKEKANSIAWVSVNIEARSKTLENRAKALSADAKALKNRSKRLKEYLLHALQVLKIDELPTEDFPKLGIAKTPPKLEIIDEHMLRNKLDASYFVHVAPSIDKNKIKEELKKGKEIPGVKLVSGVRLKM